MKQSVPFSQVFLKDPYYIEKTVKAISCEGGIVLDIGAGDGQISSLIAEKAGFLYCLEIDPNLAGVIQQKLADRRKVKVIQADIRDVSLSDLGKKIIVFSNVPYHLSSKLIEYLVSFRKNIKTNYLILQKDFAKKLSHKSGKPYGFISCMIQYYAKIKHLFDIPAGAFRPAPKVDSSLIELKFYQKKPFVAKNDDFLFRLVKKSFSQRRKKMANIIRQDFSVEALDALTKINLDLNKRPEQTSLEDFCKISDFISGFVKERV